LPTSLLLNSDTGGLPAQLLSETGGVTQEFNELRYVNKQLYRETAYTEMEYNDIMIKRKETQDDPPGAQFLSWIYALMPLTRLRLNGATISLVDELDVHEESANYMPDSARTMSHLSRFCNAHHAVTIRYHLPQLNFPTLEEDCHEDGCGEFCVKMVEMMFNSVFAASFYIPALIDEDVLHDFMTTWPDRLDRQASLARFWRESIGLDQLQASNIHYLPTSADPEALRPILNCGLGGGSYTSAMIMRWAEHGLKAS
jgi:hypothetical protein